MAYAAVVSLMQITEQILQPNYPHHSLHRSHQIISLHQKVCFLLDFLEKYAHSHITNTHTVEILEDRIKDASFRAEDIIESQICNNSLSYTKTSCFWQLCGVFEALICLLRPLYLKKEQLHLEKIIQEMDSILEEVKKIEGDENIVIQDLQRPTNSASASSPLPRTPSKTFVGFEKELMQLKNQITGYQSDLQIIPIVGMGGIGKTTLARNLYDDQLIVEHFDIRGWVTVSQEYCVRDILSLLVHDMGTFAGTPQREGTEYVAECLYKCLKGRRYFIVMDDVWDTKIWDEIKFLFPNDSNGSRIMLTSRILSVATYVDSSCNYHQMRFLNEDESWALLNRILFGNQPCPDELEGIGKRIAKSCQGLPLAIFVIGGLMSKLDWTEESWENVSSSVSSIIAINDGQCSKILSLSYNYLPLHLRPCFLYMGIFPEDSDIRVSKLIKLWVAEGFLKPIRDKSSEDVAWDNLQNLVDRNLVSVRKKGSNAKMKTCSIHDLLRDLSLREAHKQHFFNVLNRKLNSFSDAMNRSRRFIIHQSRVESDQETDHMGDAYGLPKLIPFARSFVSIGTFLYFSFFYSGFKLLRVLDMIQIEFRVFPKEIMKLVNLRYLALRCHEMLPSSILALWNLHVLIFYKRWSYDDQDQILPSEILIMPHLRHLLCNELSLPEPLKSAENTFTWENLQTISLPNASPGLIQLLKRVTNLKKLGMSFRRRMVQSLDLGHLQKLEKLKFLGLDTALYDFPVFPQSLKKLTLRNCSIPWEKMAVIGSLPNLEVLKLQNNRHSVMWEPAEGGFLRLKFLVLNCLRLEHWGADSTHFPRLETLIVKNCGKLKEIPSDIGEIPTLELIELQFCSVSSVVSARKILAEQQDMGNEDLRIRVVQ